MNQSQEMFKQREPFASLVLYNLLKWTVVSPLLHTYYRGRIYGAENVPQKRPFIVVSNHASYFDPPILASAIRRPVAYMAKEELFKVPLLKQVISLYGAYPVKRGSGDRAAMKAALKALQNGWAVGIFLEGSRTSDAYITEPKLGAAMIAAKAQVPLLPVSLWGTEKILIKGKSLPQMVPVTIRIGKLQPPPMNTQREALQATTQACAALINQMHAQGR